MWALSGHPRPARSAASATGSTSCSRATSRASRPRWPRSSTTSARSTSTGSRCCAPACSRSTTCSARCSRWSAGWSDWRSSRVLLGGDQPGPAPAAAGAVPLLLVAVWRPKVEKRRRGAGRSDARLGRHLFQVATSPPPGKEIRVTGNQADLVARRRAAWGMVLARSAAPSSASAAWTAAAWAVFSLAFVAAVVWVVDRARRRPRRGGPRAHRRRPALGVRRLRGGRARLPARHLARLRPAPGLAGGLRRPAERPRRPAGAGPPESRAWPFEGVSFAYPGTTRAVLDDVDLALPAGAVVAIVGENGAGKSTLVKLLARMYAPTSGRITADGVDINRTSTSREWRERLAGAFQDFARLEFWPRRPRSGSATSPGRTTAVAVASAVDRAGATPRGRRPARRDSTPSSARRGRAASTSASASGRSSRWPAATCGPSRCC